MSSLTPSGFSRDIAENAFKAIEEVAGALGFNAAMTCATEFINPLSLMTAFALDEIVVKNISSQNEVVKRMAEAVHFLLISRFESAFYHDVKDQIDAGAFAEAFARIAGTDSSHKTLAWYELGRALVHKKMFGMAQRCLENMDESRIEAHCLRCLWEHANAFIEDRIDYLWVRTQFEAMINCYTDRDFSKFCNGAPTDKLELATPIFNRVLDSCSIEEIRLICERAKQPDGFFRPQNLVGGFILTVFRQKFNDL
ncbi:MAG: hypothetical protein H7A36_04480 [Chlamydiales bacterium]|nr:hypothetical protein [Chlamydiales bacterium]